jgi:hypothetical protein
MSLTDTMLGMIAGSVIANQASKNKVDAPLATIAAVAAYSALLNSTTSNRKTTVITAYSQSEAIAQHVVVQSLIENSNYSLDDVEYLSNEGRRWTLSKN